MLFQNLANNTILANNGQAVSSLLHAATVKSKELSLVVLRGADIADTGRRTKCHLDAMDVDGISVTIL